MPRNCMLNPISTGCWKVPDQKHIIIWALLSRKRVEKLILEAEPPSIEGEWKVRTWT